MKPLKPVIWTKGTFLNPQHLQVQDRYLESSLQFHLDALTFRPYGFQNLQLDREALAAGNVAITSATGIFPDGLMFDIPNSDGVPPPRPMVEAFDQDQNELDAYLAIPHHRERGMNVAGGPRGADVRYRAEYQMFRDENTGLSEKPVQIASKNFRFLFGGENLNGYSIVRVARVQRTPAGLLQLDPRFVPPLLEISASDYLIAIVRRLVEIIAAKSSILSGTRRHKNLTLADFGTSDIANFWLLYTINTAFPLLQHLFEVRRGHPEELYSAMLSLAGSLSTFSTTIHPRDLPRYDHDDLSLCFTDLDEKIRILLDTVVPSNYISLPLKLTQTSSVYATALDDDKYLKDTRLYLALSAEMNEGELIGKTPNLVKICSATHIDHLMKHALPGVPLMHVARPPRSIPMKLNCQYFSLNQTGAAWEAIGRARNLAAYIPADVPNPQAELIILLPDAP